MPKLKKAPKNSYYFFITEKKDERERMGYRVGSFDNASKMFGPDWSKMTKEDKLPYERMAKEAKEREKLNMNNKFTVTGETYNQVERKAKDQKELQDIMHKFIENLSSGPEAGDRIYIIVKVVHCVHQIIDRKRKLYWPNEISLAAFSIKGGIQAIYTQLVDTVAPPTGYASEAKVCCEESMLPLPGDARYTDDTRDYLRILKNINGFLNYWLKSGYDVRGHRKVVFALEDEMIPFLNGLQWLVEHIDEYEREARRKYQKFVDTVKVYSLPKLVLSIAQDVHRVNPSYSNYLVECKLDGAAMTVITKGNYDYREEIACRFHKLEASMKMNVCTQSIVMRRIYMLFEEFVPGYGFEKVDRHSIDKLSKTAMLRGPIMTKKRNEETKKEEKKILEPDWMKDEVQDNDNEWEPSPQPNTSPNRKSNISPPLQTAPAPNEPWGSRPAPPVSFMDEDFPSLGGSTANAAAATTCNTNTSPAGTATAAWMSSPPRTDSAVPFQPAGRGRGGSVPSTAPSVTSSSTFMDDSDEDEFPSLGSNVGRGRGKGGR